MLRSLAPYARSQWLGALLLISVVAVSAAGAAVPQQGFLGGLLTGASSFAGLIALADIALSVFNTGLRKRPRGANFLKTRALIGSVGFASFSLFSTASFSISQPDLSIQGGEWAVPVVMGGLLGAVFPVVVVPMMATVSRAAGIKTNSSK